MRRWCSNGRTMMHVGHRLPLIALLWVVSQMAQARVGLADWHMETPGGNRINNYSDRSLYLKDGQQLDRLERWYFYHGCIIGEQLGEPYIEQLSDGDRYSFDERTRRWFIVDERSEKVFIYSDSLVWHRALEDKSLRPRLFTRWLVADPAVLTHGLFWIFLIARWWFIAIPVLWLVLAVMLRAWKRERFNWRKPYTICAMVIGLSVFSRILFENWLSSL